MHISNLMASQLRSLNTFKRAITAIGVIFGLSIGITPAAMAATLTASGTGVSCPAQVMAIYGAVANSPASITCTGSVTLTAGGGSVTLPSGPLYTATTNVSVANAGPDYSFSTPSSNACTAGQTLATGASCNLANITFAPVSNKIGTNVGSETVTVAPALPSGVTSGGSATVLENYADLGPVNTTQLSNGAINLGTFSVGNTTTSGTFGVRNFSGGTAVTIQSVAVTDTTDFSVSSTTCTNYTEIAGGTDVGTDDTCSVAVIAKTATAATYSTPFVITTNLGTATFTLVANTGAAPTFNSTTTETCASTTAGNTTPASCSTTYTLSATGEGVTLGATPITLSDPTDFQVSSSSSCTAGKVLAKGGTCSVILQATPKSVGTLSTTFVANTNAGVVTGGGATETATAGTLTFNPTSLACGTTSGAAPVSCPSVTVTAASGSTTFASGSYLSGYGAMYTANYTNDTCAGKTLAQGQSCTLATLTFTPTSNTSGTAENGTVTIGRGDGGTATLNYTGTVGVGSLTKSFVNGSNCTAVPVGSVANCGGIQMTATGYAVQLANSGVIASLSNAKFGYDTAGTCYPGEILAVGASCTTANITYSPTATAQQNTTITITPLYGTSQAYGALFGNAVATGVAVSEDAVACPAGYTGATVNCGSVVTLSAVGTGVTLGATPVTLGDTTHFSIVAGSTTCAANQVLSSGTNCHVQIAGTFPDATAHSTTATINCTSSGSGCGTAVSVYEVVSEAYNGQAGACPATQVGSSSLCNPITYTAVGGTVQSDIMGGSTASLNAAGLSFATNTCGGVLSAGATCTVVMKFTPPSVGTFSAQIRSQSVATGTYDDLYDTTFALTGNAAGTSTLAVSPTSVTCGSTGTGTPVSCAALTLTASGASVTLGATPFANSDATDFTVPAGTCTANLVLAVGSSCTTGAIVFNPTTGGSLTDTVSISSNAVAATPTVAVTGTGIAYTYAWVSSAWAPATGSACTTALPQTRTNTCVQSPGSATVANSYCTGTAPATSQTVSDTGGCSGTATVSSVACGSGTTGTSAACSGTVSITATAGPVLLGTASTNTVTGAYADFTYAAATSNLCTVGESLATNASCNLYTVTAFEPSNNGTNTMGVAAVVAGGTATTGTVTDTGTAYTWVTGNWSTPSNTCSASDTETRTVTCQDYTGATVDNSYCTAAAPASSQVIADYAGCGHLTVTTDVHCPSVTGVGYSGTCTGVTVTASGGPVTFDANPMSVSSAEYVVAQGTCAGATLAAGQSCSSGALTFTPAAAGSRTATLTITPSGSLGTGTTDVVGGDGGGTLSMSSINCSTVAVGSTMSCGNISVTVTMGGASFGATPITSSNPDFTIGAVSCANSTLPPSTQCAAAVSFTPTTGGTETSTFTLTASSGGSVTSTGSGVGSGSWVTSAWTPAAGASCTATLAQTRTVSCQSTTGATLPASACSGTAPATSQTVADYSGCSYSWQASGFPTSCTGGSGTWVYSAWTPANNCSASVAQSRTGACTATANSVTQTETVTCLRSDGTTVDNSLCTGTAPATTQYCTPTSGFSCGQEADLTQTVADYSGCSYSWVEGGFGACTGGQGSWTYAPWTPTTGCGTVTQTTSGTCNVVANSGTATQSVTCQRSDGTTVDNSLCTTTAPASTQSCTPTDNSVCGQEAAITQSVTLTNACTYAWVQGEFGACTGGTASWSYTTWLPATGNACTTALNQTRTGTCIQTANSGTETQSVTCQRSDGTTVAGSLCTGTAPAVTQSCTPTNASCGTEGATAQSVSDLSKCSYAWVGSGFSACSGGTGTWTYSAWTPTCGLGTVTQTRTGTCAATANTGKETQTVACKRTDGTTVANTYCTGAAPATSQSCTPTTGFSCGTEAALSQNKVMTTKCVN